MAISPKQKAHLVVCVMGAWGHIRPMLGFLARLVQNGHGGVITVITAKSFGGRIEKEWSRHFSSEELLSQGPLRLRFLEKGMVFPPDEIKLELGPVYTSIVEEHGVPHPTVFLTEALFASAPQLIRGLSRQPVSFLLWFPASMNLVYTILEKVDSLDQTLDSIHALEKEKDISFGEAANQFLTSTDAINAEPIHMPDLPPMSGYELYPQEPPYIIAFGEFFLGCMRLLASCDGIVTSTSYVVEPKGCQSVARLLQKRNNGKFFAVGPLDVTDVQAKDGELAQSEVALTVEGFLNNVLETRGPKSLLYISFGSLFSPTEPEKFIAWIKVVQELDIPLILVAPAGITLPDTMRESTPTRLICQWAPQQFILSHPATGAFLTHNGSNGTHESLSGGIPMISWPFISDQPIFAMLVEQTLKVGYELNEVRRGHGLQHRLSLDVTPTGTVEAVQEEARRVLKKLFFDKVDRASMEKRIQSVRRSLVETWIGTEHGVDGTLPSAIGDVERFIQAYLPRE